MSLGKRIKAARLEAGLSQNALCDGKITRNMLSLIENDAATPSLDTLQHLSQMLGKPMGFLLDGEMRSPNADLLRQARNVSAQEALPLLKDYQTPDSVHDSEYYLLLSDALMTVAEQALQEGKTGYCRELLQQAESAIGCTPYCRQALLRRLTLLQFSLGDTPAAALAEKLPGDEGNLLLGAAALERSDYAACRAYLHSENSEKAVFLRAESYFLEKDYFSACREFEKLPETPQVLSRLEACWRELGNFEKAYFYACKQRNQ